LPTSKASSSEKIQSSTIGAAGEHFVLAHLLRHDFIAGKAPDNTKDFDLVVLSRNGTRSFPIQVKTVTDAPDWVLKQKHETPIKGLFFVLVRFHSDNAETDCYVVDSETVAKVTKKENDCWLRLPARRGKSRKNSDMRKFSIDLSKLLRGVEHPEKFLSATDISFLRKHSLGWLERYRDAWHLLQGQ
jgi:hypothetical protein